MHGQLAETFCAIVFRPVEGPFTSKHVPRLVASMAPHDGHMSALDPDMLGTLPVGLSVNGGGSLSHTQFTASLTSSPPPTDSFLLPTLGTQHMIPTPRLPFLGMWASFLHGLHSHNILSSMGLTLMGQLWAL